MPAHLPLLPSLSEPLSLRGATRSRIAFALPLFAAAIWLLAPSSTALAGGPPCRPARQHNTIRIVFGTRIGDRGNDRRDRDRCEDDRRERDYGRHDDLLYRGDARCETECYFGLDSEAWCDLTSERYVRAKREFLDLIDCRPCEPVPRIGYAIACGRLEHWREAEQSMRRAVDLDVKALDAIRVDSQLKGEIRCLIEQYQATLRCDHANPDTYFMIASLQSILGCYDDALCSIESARRYGDCSSSARTLQCHIESKIKCDGRREGNRGEGNRGEGRGSGRGRR